MFFDRMLNGFAYHKIIVDKTGKPIDYVFLEVNHAFENITGLKRELIIGKKATEVLVGIENDPADWIGIYGKVGLTCEPVKFENYNEPLRKWFNVAAYCPEKGYFVALFEDITQRKKVEDTLRESEERFRLALRNTPVSVAAQDCDLKYIWAYNQRNASPNQIIGKLDKDIFSMQEAVYLDKIKQRVLKENIELREQSWFNMPSGRIFLDFTWSPIQDKDGKVIGVTSATVDLTKMKLAEEAERKQASLIDLSPDAIIVKKLDDTITFWSQGAESLYGYSKKEAIGQKSHVLFKTKYQPYEQISQFAYNGRWSGEKIHKTKFGNEIIVDSRWLASCNARNEIEEILEINVDITEQKKAEESLKENEHLYRTVFDNSQDGFQLIELMYDENGEPFDHKFLKINSAYEKIMGVKSDATIGKSARSISPNCESYWFEVPERVIKTGKSEHIELYNKGINKTLDCYYFKYSKNVVGTLFSDVTERKKLERQLQDSERLAAIGATAGMVGHDIRNPLQAITSDVFLAMSELDSLPESEEKKNTIESLNEIEKNIDYINKIVQDLQDYARPLNPKTEESDLKQIVESFIARNNLPENVEVNVKVPDDARKIIADSYYLNRILFNLITNAVQAMPQGGKIDICTYNEANATVITVTDTGVGIPKNLQEKMFTLMFTTKSKGQGFGLPVVKRMTEALGGTVSFESQEGKGTTFIIRLPLKEINGK